MARTLLIGLDSADAELIERWCAAGDLPTLASLRQQGTWGRLETSARVMHVSAWPTLYTGASPGRHGLYHAYQVRPHEQGVHRTSPDEGALSPFWRYLDDAGRRCIVFDAFMDARLERFRGAQVLEYGTWTWFGSPGSTPRRLLKQLVRNVGPYPAPEHLHVLSVPDPVRFRDQLVRGAEVKARAARWLLRQQPWDMAFITFGEPHGGGHYLWHTGDPEHPASREYDIAAAPNALRDVYIAVDRAIGSVLEDADDETTVMVASADGMGPNYSGCHLMPEMLRRLGWLSTMAQREGAPAEGTPPRSSPGLLSRLRGVMPLGARQAVTRCLPRSVHYRLSMKWVNDAIDWERSRVFCIPNANEAYFRLNLRGREPRGLVEPGAEETALLGELREEMRGLVNPDTHRCAAEQVATISEMFPGPERGRLPDLAVSWNAGARVLGRVSAPRSGLVEGDAGYRTGAAYTGNHRPNAFVAVRGPGVAEGAEVQGYDIRDIAPTVLALLGVDAPAHFEGRVIPGITDGGA
ncbi:MAG TPA: alkaline phosphatase family protein [Gemmatimonadaceae bacterium]|nr:alkaline phosphatase family protein [Gemmatimonadaceae bacterium]